MLGVEGTTAEACEEHGHIGSTVRPGAWQFGIDIREIYCQNSSI